MNLVAKRAILERDGELYSVIVADEEYFVVGSYAEIGEGCTIVMDNVEVFPNDCCTSLEEMGFKYVGTR